MDFNVRFEEYVNELVTDCKIYSMSGRQAFCQALWDTGAECSVISSTLVSKMNLVCVAKAEMYHAGGDSNIVNCYDVYVGFTDDMVIGPIRVMEGQYDSDIILIGMDIIGSGDLIVTNNSGHTEMAFTIPSFLIIDNIMNMKN